MSEKKKGILEDCLYKFWKLCIKKNVKEEVLKSLETPDEVEKAHRLDPIIVEVMYIQLFIELRRNGVEYDHRDFGIGENEEFRFDGFYREDHPQLFSTMWDI